MKTTHRNVCALLVLLLTPGACAGVTAAPQRAGAERVRVVVRGSLTEVTGVRRVALLISKSLVVDAREPALVALEDHRRALAGSPPRQHRAGARLIAARLNRHIRRNGMMTAAQGYAEADLVIVFKVTAQRASAIPTEPFVWGKMYVIAVGADGAARIVWESDGDQTPPEDATDDFLKAYRAARGEK